jgi:hypothetical protein
MKEQVGAQRQSERQDDLLWANKSAQQVKAGQFSKAPSRREQALGQLSRMAGNPPTRAKDAKAVAAAAAAVAAQQSREARAAAAAANPAANGAAANAQAAAATTAAVSAGAVSTTAGQGTNTAPSGSILARRGFAAGGGGASVYAPSELPSQLDLAAGAQVAVPNLEAQVSTRDGVEAKVSRGDSSGSGGGNAQNRDALAVEQQITIPPWMIWVMQIQKLGYQYFRLTGGADPRTLEQLMLLADQVKAQPGCEEMKLAASLSREGGLSDLRLLAEIWMAVQSAKKNVKLPPSAWVRVPEDFPILEVDPEAALRAEALQEQALKEELERKGGTAEADQGAARIGGQGYTAPATSGTLAA